jgi:hypothetical protein
MLGEQNSRITWRHIPQGAIGEATSLADHKYDALQKAFDDIRRNSERRKFQLAFALILRNLSRGCSSTKGKSVDTPLP